MFSFGFNAFMGFNVQSSAVVQDLLGRTDLKLEDLLDEEAVIYEVKTQNQKLLDFLLDAENFKSLINYIITEPEIDDFDFDQKRIFKYPFVCADLLSAESNPIVDEFFKSKQELEEAERAEAQREKDIEKQIEEAEDQSDSNVILDKEKALEDNAEVIIDKDELAARNEAQHNDTSKSVESKDMTEEEVAKIKKDGTDFVYLNQLFSILDTKEVNLTCAGYFAKVASTIFGKKPAQLLSFIFKTRPELLDNMINHIASKSIAEFLGKILTFESSLLDDVHDQAYNEERVRALRLILQKLEPSSDIEGINNSAYLICEVFGKYNAMHGTQEVLGKMLESSVIDSLYRILNLRDPIPSCAAALVLGNIFAYYILINTKMPEHNPEEIANLETPHAHPHLHLQHTELSSEIPLIAAFLENIKSIIDYIATPLSSEEIETQFGAKIVPFGAAKLKFLELLIISMKANNKEIYNKLIDHGFFENLLDLIVRYEWNNMLHSQIEKIITFVIDGANEDLKTALLEKAGLLDFIIRVYSEEEIPLKGKHERKVRRGYLGHVVKISNRIIESNDPIIQKNTQNSASWAEYTKTKLADINTKDKLHLGGKDPRIITETLANPQGLELPSIMEKFSKFFNIQTKPEQKNLEDEVVDRIDGDDISGTKEENILTEGIPKDEMVLKEEEQGLKVEPPLNTAPENPDSPDIAPRGRASFGMKNNRRVGGYGDDEDNEDDGNMLWFSDPTKKAEEAAAAEEKKPEEEKTEQKTSAEKAPRDDIVEGEGEGYPTAHFKPEGSHTAEDLLKEAESKSD